MKKVRFCYIFILIFVTSFKLPLAVFPYDYVWFNMIEKWNFKKLVYFIGEKSGLNKSGLKFSWGKI